MKAIKQHPSSILLVEAIAHESLYRIDDAVFLRTTAFAGSNPALPNSRLMSQGHIMIKQFL